MSDEIVLDDPLDRLAALNAEQETIAARRAAIVADALAEIPAATKRLGALCNAAGVFVPRKDLAAAGIISLREDESVKRPARKPKAEKPEVAA